MSYTSAFFENHAAGSRQSADRIAGIVADLLHPQSVVDVGCGLGTWLAAFQAHGARELAGLDGDYVDRSLLQIPTECFQPIDLSRALSTQTAWPERRFDLAISLEVGEHLPPDLSEALVERLTQLAPAVLFSAAIPRQAGTGHVNERWQSDWARLFHRHGLWPHDVVRHEVWSESAVEPWYAQNVLLYLPEEPAMAPTLDLVHPRLWEKNLRNATLRARVRNEAQKAFWSVASTVRSKVGPQGGRRFRADAS